MRNFLTTLSLASGALLLTAGASLAAAPAAPGPVAAVGMPALLVIGGAVLAVRYFRSRGK